MSLEAMISALWAPDCTPAEKVVLLGLANHANPQRMAWPSQALLSRYTGMSIRNVRRVLNALEARNLIQRMPRQRQDRSRTSDLFWILTPPPPAEAWADKLSAPEDADVRGERTRMSGREPSKRTNPTPCGVGGARRSTRCPVDWMPSEAILTWASSAEVGLSPAETSAELAKFRDYEFRTPRSDWPAAFRNWLRNAAKRGASQRRPGRAAWSGVAQALEGFE